MFLSASTAAKKKASIKLPSSFSNYNSTVSDQANLPCIIQSPSVSVALELLITFSIKFVISTLISLNVFVCWLYSEECIRDVNSRLNFISPSLGLPGLGQIIFRVL